MQQIEHMKKGGAVLFYVVDDEKVTVLASGNDCDFEKVEKVAAERYLKHLADPNRGKTND